MPEYLIDQTELFVIEYDLLKEANHGADATVTFLDYNAGVFTKRTGSEVLAEGWNAEEGFDPVQGADGMWFYILDLNNVAAVLDPKLGNKVPDIAMNGSIYHGLRTKPPFGQPRVWRIFTQLTEDNWNG